MELSSSPLTDVLARPPSVISRAVLYSLVALLTCTAVWLVLGKLDMVSRAEGKLVPLERLQIVQPLENGKIQTILVREGELVEAGSLLVQMEPTLVKADLSNVQDELNTVTEELSRTRLEAEFVESRNVDVSLGHLRPDTLRRLRLNRKRYFAERDRLQQSLSELRAKLVGVRASISKSEAVLPLLKKQESALRELHQQKFGSEYKLIEIRKERIEMEHDLKVRRQTLQALKARMQRADTEIQAHELHYRKNLEDEALTLKRQRQELTGAFEKLTYREAQLQIRAPVNGVVQDLATHTEGTVVAAGTVLLKLVPVDEPLQAEVYLPNRDVGFVKPGQPVRVKLSAFEFQKYGWLDGEVSKVSADAVESPSGDMGPVSASGPLVYRTLVELKSQTLLTGDREFPLRPGMHITSEVKLGRRSVLEYLLSPISKTLQEAGTEL